MSPDIPRDIADTEGVPDDLDSTVDEPFGVVSPKRRRLAARVYAVGALAAAAGAVTALPWGLWVLSAALAGVAVYHWASGWELVVGAGQALEIANRAVPFAVGHASAQVSFVGWRARPIWDVLVFSVDEPPTQRGLVRVDAVSGDVVETYAEEIGTQ